MILLIIFALWYAVGYVTAHAISYGAKNRADAANEMMPYVMLMPLLLAMMAVSWASMEVDHIVRAIYGLPPKNDSISDWIP